MIRGRWSGGSTKIFRLSFALLGRYIKSVASLESQCDKDVEAVLSDLRTELEAQGKDTSIIETLRKAYNEEKSLKKAY